MPVSTGRLKRASWSAGRSSRSFLVEQRGAGEPVCASERLEATTLTRRLVELAGSVLSALGRPPKPVLFSRTGFTPEFTEEASRRLDVELIDPALLYQGE